MTDLIKTDCLGRITVSREQREAMLDAFEASSMSGQAFAKHHGINYQTFASWIQKRRHARGDYEPIKNQKTQASKPDILPQLTLAEVALDEFHPKTSIQPLKLTLPQGVEVEIQHPNQLPLISQLVETLTSRSPC